MPLFRHAYLNFQFLKSSMPKIRQLIIISVLIYCKIRSFLEQARVPRFRHLSSNLSNICMFVRQMLKIIDKRYQTCKNIIRENKKIYHD